MVETNEKIINTQIEMLKSQIDCILKEFLDDDVSVSTIDKCIKSLEIERGFNVAMLKSKLEALKNNLDKKSLLQTKTKIDFIFKLLSVPVVGVEDVAHEVVTDKKKVPKLKDLQDKEKIFLFILFGVPFLILILLHIIF